MVSYGTSATSRQVATWTFEAWGRSRKAAIDRQLLSTLPPKNGTRLFQAMHYAVLNGGKRLRPLLCINAAETLGAGNNRKVLSAACAVELVHCYSLIHDDLPSMDNDDMRRGKPSCHIKFGEATTLLTGTSLLTLAFEVLASQGREPMRLLADATGCLGMNLGQFLDMELTGQPSAAKANRVLEMHRFKTGKMVSVSMQLGAHAAGTERQSITTMKRLGDRIGKLYQIVDDIVDESPTHASIGKTPGKDRRQKKASVVTTLGMDRALQLLQETHSDIASTLRRSRTNHRHLGRIIDLIVAPVSRMPLKASPNLHPIG